MGIRNSCFGLLVRLGRIGGKVLCAFILEPFEKWIPKVRTEEQENQLKMASKLSESGGVTTYHLNHPLKFAAIVLPAVFNGLRAKPSPETAFAFASTAAGLSVVGLFRLAHRYIEKAMAKATSLKDPFLLTRVQVYKVFVLQFSNCWRESLELVLPIILQKRHYLDGMDLMNASYGGVSCMTLLSGYHGVGEQAMLVAKEYLESIENSEEDKQGHPFLATLIPTYAALGKLNQVKSMIPLIEKYLAKVPDDHTGHVGFYASMLAFFYETGDIWNPKIDQYKKDGKKFVFLNPALCMPHFKFFYVFSALIYWARYTNAGSAKDKKSLQCALQEALRDLR